MDKYKTYTNEEVVARLEELRDATSMDLSKDLKFYVGGVVIKTLHVELKGSSNFATIVIGHNIDRLMDTSDDWGEEFMTYLCDDVRLEIEKYGNKALKPEDPYDKFLRGIKGGRV